MFVDWGSVGRPNRFEHARTHAHTHTHTHTHTRKVWLPIVVSILYGDGQHYERNNGLCVKLQTLYQTFIDLTSKVCVNYVKKADLKSVGL